MTNRQQRIRKSLNKINQLMTELKNTTNNGSETMFVTWEKIREDTRKITDLLTSKQYFKVEHIKSGNLSFESTLKAVLKVTDNKGIIRDVEDVLKNIALLNNNTNASNSINTGLKLVHTDGIKLRLINKNIAKVLQEPNILKRRLLNTA